MTGDAMLGVKERGGSRREIKQPDKRIKTAEKLSVG